MAEGFLIPSRASEDMEKVGNEYFSILLNNSFFNDQRKNVLGAIKSCKMHDLVHDLAKSVADTEYYSIMNIYDMRELEIQRAHRVRVVLQDEASTIPEDVYKVKKLPTFISPAPKFVDDTMAMHIISNFRYLRVLDLSNSDISELPSSIAKLRHLRYLDLSNSQLKKLPDSFPRLYNLQTLILKNCSMLKDLPPNMRKLSRLQYLPVFVVCKSTNGFGIEELRELNLLAGKLTILNLENVRDGKNAQGADLKQKRFIRRLDLYWTKAEDRNIVSCGDCEVLEGLLPHANLKMLRVYNYAGSVMPTWMMNPNNLLPNLVFLSLTECQKCENLPSLGSLPSLKVLHLKSMHAVNHITSDFYGNNINSVSFPSLEELSLDDMPNLVEWSQQVSSCFVSFPRLERLKVRYCMKLKVMPTRFPSLNDLDLLCVNGNPIKSLVAGNLTSLTSIQIVLCTELVYLPLGLFRGNGILLKLIVAICKNFRGFIPDQIQEDVEEELQIQSLPSNSLYSFNLHSCHKFVHWPEFQGFESLRVLHIVGLANQKIFPRGIEYLPKLEELSVGIFSDELLSFPFPSASIKEGTVIGPYFPSLRSLIIIGGYWCTISCLPDDIQYITSLQYLHIRSWDCLVALPEWLGNMASLRELQMFCCQEMKHLPSLEQMRRLSSLQLLNLHTCPLLAERCGEEGEEWDKISHIPKLEIDKDHMTLFPSFWPFFSA